MSKALQLRLGFVFLLSLFFLSLLVKESFGKINEQDEEIAMQKIDPELLNLEGETTVIIEFSNKPNDYRQFIRSLEGTVVHDYNSIEGVAVKIRGENIRKLAKFENMVKVHKAKNVRTLLHESAPLISADDVWNLGFTGKDVRVCVIDTGVDYTHPALGSCSPLIFNGNIESYILQSQHPYPASYNYTWTITKPGYTKIAVHFVNISLDEGYDFLYVKDANGNTVQSFTGDHNDVWSVSVPGNTIKINLVSDWYLSLYGFYMDKVINGSISFGFDNCKKIVAGIDIRNNDADPMDDNSHGTHVTGIVSSDDSYYKGISNGTKILIAKVLDAYGNGIDSDVIAGIDWCLNNSADIISMSLGGDLYQGTCDDDILAKAVNSANDKGVVVVVAAGNDGQYGLGTPACASGAIAVGATDKTNNVVGFSSKGSELDIVAPGYKIKSTFPDNWWSTKSGTSMSAPHVSGVIALMLEANPSLSVAGIKRILNETSDPVNKCYECTWESGDCTNYYGTEIQCTTNVTGSGVVNASKAISRSQSDCEITVQYQDNCPRSGATVYTISPETVLDTTDENGKLSCNSLSDGNYSIKATWPDQNSQFGNYMSLVIINGYGRAIIEENSDYTNGTEACGDNECSGFQYCVGDTKHIECNSWNTECDTKKCCQCNGGTLFNPKENYDSSQNSDCNIFNLERISTCDWTPDNYHLTWDLRNPFTSQCIGLDQCAQGDATINHTCSKSQCSAQCENNSDCSEKCDGKKWYSSYGCNNQCNCDLNNPICSKSRCGAECEKDSDCSIGICRADCTCGVWESIYSGSYPVIDIEDYNSKLYFASNKNEIYIFDGSNWNTILAPLDILSLQSYGGKLYVAGGPGKVYTYDGSAWSSEPVLSIDEPYTTEYLRMLGVYNNTLYAGSYLDKPVLLYYCNGSCDNSSNWHLDTDFNSIITPICGGPFCSIDSMGVYNGKMYLNVAGILFVYNGSWSILNQNTETYSVSGMKVYNSKLYLATRDSNSRCPYYQGYSGFCGRVIEYDGTNWNTILDHNGSGGYWMFSLEVYNGRLYAGTANRIYMSSDGTNWELTYNSASGAEYALDLKTWNNRIYVGFGNGVVAKDDMLEPLNLKLLSPASTTYTTSSVPLTFAINRPVSWIGYSLDNKPNVTITGNTTLAGLINGGHNIIVYANETIGKIVSSKVYFTVSVPTCTCTTWVWDEDRCCRYRTCKPRGCNSERSCSKYCIL